MATAYIETPGCFKPLICVTRSTTSTGGVTTYQDLSKYVMTKSEKLWLCREVDVINGNKTGQGEGKSLLISRYRLSRSIFKFNYPTYLKTGSVKTKGGQYLLQSEDFLPIAQKIKEVQSTGEDMLALEVRIMMDQVATKKSYDNNIPRQNESMTDRTYKNTIKRLHVKNISSGSIDEAAIAARKCPIASYIWYLVVAAVSQYIPASNKWNLDGSTFIFETPLQGAKIARLKPESEYYIEEDEIKLPKQGKLKTPKGYGLPYGIKVMQMISAYSETSPFVCIISVRDMEPDDWHVESVLGLSITTNVGATGYIYFSKTRCKPKGMWTDYFTRVVLPTIKASRGYHEAKDDEGNLLNCSLSMDNEAAIIQCVYDEDLKQQFEEINTDVINVSPNHTGIHQSSDRSPAFSGVKTSIHKMQKNNVKVHNEPLERNILQAFSNLVIVKPYLKTTIKSSYQMQICRGLLVLTHVYPTSLSRKAIRAGYEVTGQHIYGEQEDGITISFERIMRNCYSTVPKAQMELMKRLAPQFIEDIKSTGMVKYTDVIAAGILPGETSKDRDNLCYYHQFPKIVTHEGTLRRFALEQSKKTPEFKEAVLKQKNDSKDLAKALKLIAADDHKKAMQELRINQKRQREQDEAAENEKYQNMSKNQKIKYDKEQEKIAQENAQEMTKSKNEQKALKQLKADKILADARALIQQNSQSDIMEESDSSND